MRAVHASGAPIWFSSVAYSWTSRTLHSETTAAFPSARSQNSMSFTRSRPISLLPPNTLSACRAHTGRELPEIQVFIGDCRSQRDEALETFLEGSLFDDQTLSQHFVLIHADTDHYCFSGGRRMFHRCGCGARLFFGGEQGEGGVKPVCLVRSIRKRHCSNCVISCTSRRLTVIFSMTLTASIS